MMRGKQPNSIHNDMVGSSRPPFPSAPSEPSLRRLGTAGSGNGDRPIRAQLIVGLVVLIILLAVPLYLWRRPSVRTNASDAGTPAGPISTLTPPAANSATLPPPFQVEHARTSPLQRVRCGANRARASTGLTCDALPALERAFVEAVQQSFDCAPRTTKEGSINHVLEVDFTRKTLHVFPGKSGDWHGPSARRVTKCVERIIGKPDFSAMPHAHAYYAFAVMATYPSTTAVPQISASDSSNVKAPQGSSALGGPSESASAAVTASKFPKN